MFPDSQREEFLAYWKVLLSNIRREEFFLKCDNCVLEHFVKSFEYNVRGGKCIRGMLVKYFFDAIKESGGVSCSGSDNFVILLGWIIEMMQAVFLILDDIMDSSFTRRGNPCWYKKEEVGLMAINDAQMLLSYAKVLISENLKEHPKCLDLLCLIDKVEFFTTIGQSLDMHMCISSLKRDYSKFSAEKCNEICQFKTYYYSFYFPFMFAYYLFEDPKLDEDDLNSCLKVLQETGILFQIQDDYLDCFGCPEVVGKIGTDINEGKCTWLAGTAFSMMNETQSEIFVESYGNNDPKLVEAIKNLYDELGIEKLYHEKVSEISTTIGRVKSSKECAVLHRCKLLHLYLLNRNK